LRSFIDRTFINSMSENVRMITRPAASVPRDDPPSGIDDPRRVRLLEVAERANAAALLLHDAVRVPHVELVRSRKAVRTFAAYSKAISVVKGRPHSAAEHLLLGVAENTLRILSQVYVVWTTRPRTSPFSEVEKKAFSVLFGEGGSAGSLPPLPNRDPVEAVEAVAKRIEDLGGDVVAVVEDVAAPSVGADAGTAFEAASGELLERAGGALSLTEAAERLKVSRQRIHKRIQEGTVLGMRGLDGTILVPAIQLEAHGEGERLIPGIEHAVRPFMEAGEGGWAALQWMLDSDPNLAATPLEAIRAGRFGDVTRAARAYVGADGG
jgi:hypothetical protein